MKIQFTVLTNPIPWRRAQRKGERYYTHHKVAEFQEEVIGAFLEAYGSILSFPAIPKVKRKRNIILVLRFYRGDYRECDLSNLEKGIEDALEGYLWEDDWQIQRKTSEVLIDRENPRVEIEAWETDANRTNQGSP